MSDYRPEDFHVGVLPVYEGGTDIAFVGQDVPDGYGGCPADVAAVWDEAVQAAKDVLRRNGFLLAHVASHTGRIK